MTTVVYKKGVIAADTLVTQNGSVVGYASKIGKKGAVLWGASGALSGMQGFMRWVMLGAPRDDLPTMRDHNGETDCEGFIAFGDYIVTLNPEGMDIVSAPDGWAIGSGEEFARGALACGFGPEKAVRASMKWDLHTGGRVEVLKADPE